jgi:hypothetical protein
LTGYVFGLLGALSGGVLQRRLPRGHIESLPLNSWSSARLLDAHAWLPQGRNIHVSAPTPQRLPRRGHHRVAYNQPHEHTKLSQHEHGSRVARRRRYVQADFIKVAYNSATTTTTTTMTTTRERAVHVRRCDNSPPHSHILTKSSL